MVIDSLNNPGLLFTLDAHIKDMADSKADIEAGEQILDIAPKNIKEFTNTILNNLVILQKLEKELYKINQQILLVENYINKKKTNEDYTPKKGSGRGQSKSIKHIPKKGSGRSQYVDPYDRSIPKRYM